MANSALVALDLVSILRARIAGLPDGDHRPGLRAVLSHVEVAATHWKRGSDLGEEELFTDSIYRCNQAFEGSLKEAYRVLSGNAPEGETPFNIEKYLERENVLRQRVQVQLTRYRTEWRNPSAHDYKLDFNEDEALLAIVSVTAFAAVLIDQIVQKLGQASAEAKASPPGNEVDGKLIDQLVMALMSFIPPESTGAERTWLAEQHFLGALNGHLAAFLPTVRWAVEETLVPGRPERPDLVARRGDESVVIEIKRHRSSASAVAQGVDRLGQYLETAGIANGLLVFMPEKKSEMWRTSQRTTSDGRHSVFVAEPIAA